MHRDSALVHLGRTSAAAVHAVNPPLVRASTVVFETLEEYRHSYQGRVFESSRYGRSGTVTTFELQEAMARLENAETCIATSSGLSAIAAVLGAHAGPGKHILVYNGVYGPTRVFCEQSLTALGTKISFFNDSAEVGQLIDDKTSLVFIEVPSSLTMQMLDITQVCAAARERGIPVACDSTWGSPMYFNAHALGIDISIHAATKFINGHSDVILGLVTGAYSTLDTTRKWCDRHGSHASPDACWLTLRGLRTLAVRMPRHQASAIEVAKWLSAHSKVKRVMFPVLASDPGHALWKRQFSGGAGPFTFELQPCNEAAFERFINALKLFGLGTSWGGYESLVMPAISHELRSIKTLPDEGRLVRLHIGLEHAPDLCADLAQAFDRMEG
ncbi:trans-sulfuration enzyme family protein [Pseudomonas sp. R1-6]|uniref:trans-sulfuration enzyme family protein n=1 Tax=Pseudomonas sp. R1-6 TaxID=2817397 RepID=UPI003DA85922